MSTKRKRAVLSIKDKQIIISRLDKGETSPQMSDEEILATIVGDLTESENVCSDEEDEGEDEKLVSTKEAA